MKDSRYIMGLFCEERLEKRFINFRMLDYRNVACSTTIANVINKRQSWQACNAIIKLVSCKAGSGKIPIELYVLRGDTFGRLLTILVSILVRKLHFGIIICWPFQLLSNPRVLLLDEPTTGLDAFVSKMIIIHLSKLARYGYTIVCAIHQPSSDVFRMFDR